MKEIKFRFWGGEVLRMSNPMPLDEVANSEGITGLTPLQFTGLKDKNGEEIYEGDILRWTDGDGSIGVVLWREGDVCFDTEPLLNGLSSAHAIWYEIVGNIFENPELLKETIS